MGNFFKIKNIKISIFSFLILNQFLLSADALNSRKIYEVNANVKNFQKKTNNENRISSTQKTKNENQNFLNEAIELEKFVDENASILNFSLVLIPSIEDKSDEDLSMS